MEEYEIIPFQVSSPPPGPWLVFAPHPDDEALGMGGSLLLARDAGINVVLVFVTDGARGGGAESSAGKREQEAKEAAHLMGVCEVKFWKQPDRRLAVSKPLIEKTSALIQVLEPASIFFPSPMEFHPDHRAVAFLVWEGMREAETLAKAYSYEISTQGRVNLLVDITDVAERKRAVIAVYNSQLLENDYMEVSLSLNKARTYTLPSKVAYAEGFYVYDNVLSGDLTDHLLSSLRPLLKAPRCSTVSVVIRTKNRPDMLRKALKSVAEQNYTNIEVIVVNDGGVDAAPVIDEFRGVIARVDYRCLDRPRGRAAAANAGICQSKGDYLLLLDDDDWMLQDHVAKLVRILDREQDVGAVYTGVKCVEVDKTGVYRDVQIYDDAYDPFRLLIQNYIPMHAVLFRSQLVESSCSFDESLEMYEDWDFWVQLSHCTQFRHVPGVSAIYRVSESSGFAIRGNEYRVTRGELAFFAKWRHIWTDDQFLTVVGHARKGLTMEKSYSWRWTRPLRDAVAAFLKLSDVINRHCRTGAVCKNKSD